MDMSIAKISRGRSTSLGDDGIVSATHSVAMMEDRLSHVCQSLANYARKSAKFRNASDDLADALRKLWTSCPFDSNKPLNNRLQLLSDSLAFIADLRDDHVRKMSAGVNKMSRFRYVCKKTKNDLKNLKKQCNAHSMTDMDSSSVGVEGEEAGVDRSPIVADKAYEYANEDSYIDDIMTRFQEHEVTGLNDVLAELGRAELAYHCKAVEVLTEALASFSDVDTDPEAQEASKDANSGTHT